MLRDIVTTCALFVSVTGIGISLAREEMRCYLGLQSTECPASQMKSASPSSGSEVTQTNQQTQDQSKFNQDTKSLTKTTKPLSKVLENAQDKSLSSDNFSTNSNESRVLKPNQDNFEPKSTLKEISRNQPIPVEPILESNTSEQKSIPHHDSSLDSTPKTFGIPIKVEPFQESVD